MDREYTITIKVASGGTQYIYQEDKAGHKKGDVISSLAGHMWLSGSDGVSRNSAGFESRDGEAHGLGKLSDSDDQAYQSTAHELTIKVTKEQYETFRKFSKNPELYGFDRNTYKLLNNSCIDYAWAGLKAIGLNPADYDGELLPVSNISKVSQFVRQHGAEVIQEGLVRNGDYMDSGESCLWLDPYLQSKVAPNAVEPSFFQKLLAGDFQLSKLLSLGKISQSLYQTATQWVSDALTHMQSFFGVGPVSGSSSGLNHKPIGAYYESSSPTADNSASIAQKTPVLLDGQHKGLTEAALAGRDSNNDGRLSGDELNGLNAWADLNENGVMDAGELQTLAQAGVAQIRNTDYALYTRGNGRVAPTSPLAPAAPVAPGEPGAPARPNEASDVPARVSHVQAVPASNFRALRDTDNVFVTSSGAITWAPTQIKINSKNPSYLIGTDATTCSMRSTTRTTGISTARCWSTSWTVGE